MTLLKLTSFSLLLLAVLPACGDNLKPLDPDGDGGLDDIDARPGDGDGGLIDARPVDASLDASSNAPTVVSTSPANMAMNVSFNPAITATFSRPMNPATINAVSFTVRQGANVVAGAVTYAGSTATFRPTLPLAPSLPYTATITTMAADPMGQMLAANHVWTFNTRANNAVCALDPVNLRTAANFAVLAGAAVSSTGPTSVTGDLGVSPGSSVTGFPPGTLIGMQHAANPTAAQAVADARTAYNDAAARTLCAVTVAGNLGGMTLAPGLYKSTSSLEISAGNLTLDAGGDANAVFIFQMASTLTTSPGRQVILAGGAQGKNITWQVATSATLGTTTAFHGTIIADQAVTLGTGATLGGRALAIIAATTLDSNPIVRPAP